MEIDDIFDGEQMEFPKKFMDTKSFVRMGADGLPQIIRVEPLIRDHQLVPQNVVLTIDEAVPQVMGRWEAAQMLHASQCVPLENYLSWKHLIRH